MSTPGLQDVSGSGRPRAGVWLKTKTSRTQTNLANLTPTKIQPEIISTEDEVGRAQLAEIQRAAESKSGDLVIILLGGRGAQAMYRQIAQLAQTSALDELLGRLHVFTQDALAPLSMTNPLNFVADFRRLLGEAFFRKVKSFTPMRTDVPDLQKELTEYAAKLESLGGIDIFFMGLGPEPGGASHLMYIKPGSGASSDDIAGMIPIYSSVLDHHITKFKAGGATITAADEAECRAATHVMTLGPASILESRRIVQSIVDAGTAPAKRESYRKMLDTEISADSGARALQLDANPVLWLRLHPNVRSLVLPDVLTA